MADLRQELADVQAAIGKIEAQVAPQPAPAPMAPGRIRLRHPATGDVKEVDATPEVMIPLMGLGYEQVKGE